MILTCFFPTAHTIVESSHKIHSEVALGVERKPFSPKSLSTLPGVKCPNINRQIITNRKGKCAKSCERSDVIGRKISQRGKTDFRFILRSGQQRQKASFTPDVTSMAPPSRWGTHEKLGLRGARFSRGTTSSMNERAIPRVFQGIGTSHKKRINCKTLIQLSTKNFKFNIFNFSVLISK